MKKKSIVGFIFIISIIILSGCNEQKTNDNENVEINYNDMQKFTGLWLNQSSEFPQYYLVTDDGRIFTLDEQQGDELINDYETFSKTILNTYSYKKYRFVEGYFELLDLTNGKYVKFATYNFQNDDIFVFDIINNGSIICSRIEIG